MGIHPRANSVVAKRLWNVLKITFFMIRKGLISKRKLITDLNLLMKRGKLLRKSLKSLLSLHQHHHHHSRRVTRGSFGLREYEFSCRNTPNPFFFHVEKRKHHYFPCISASRVMEDDEYDNDDDDRTKQEADAVALVPKTPDFTNFQLDAYDFASGERHSPLLSPFNITVAEYSSEDEENDGSNKQVDTEAEEFIRRFYEYLRAQSRIQLLRYQEVEYQEMLARGA